MPSILDKDGPRKIIVPPDPVPAYLLGFISIILILAFLLWLLFVIKNGAEEDVALTCAPGQCVTNIFNGIKTCPDQENQSLVLDPETEVCNSPFVCENPRTPFAVQLDGSTRLSLCEKNVKCRCLQKPQCSTFTTSTFSIDLGNPFQSPEQQKFSLLQKTDFENLAMNIIPEPPFSLESETRDFCQIPREWLPFVWPSVVDEDGDLTSCLKGSMAFFPEDPENFNTTEDVLNETLLSCVIGGQCPKGKIPFFDTRVNKLRCIE